MIIVDFANLGNKIKITIEGNQCMNKVYEGHERLNEIKELNNALMDRKGEKYKSIYEWCKGCCAGKSKRGRHELFAF